MKPVVVAMPGNEQLADDLAAHLSLERGAATVRRFPDGESYARVESAIEGRVTLIACTLDRPDDKLVPLLLLSAAVREAGALSVGLVAPYLPTCGKTVGSIRARRSVPSMSELGSRTMSTGW